MILIFFSWLLLFCFFLTSGVALASLLKIHTKNIAITILLGMVAQTVLLTIAAFFIPIGLECFAGNAILTLLLGYFFRNKIKNTVAFDISNFKKLTKSSKIILLITLVTALLKCAQSPFILDNESYYMQTIKWLNEYGFVKGLANLNIAYGQTSAWHVLQSGFNFSFLTNRINDINGFLLLVCTFFFLSKFDKRFESEKRFHWIGFIVLINVLSFQFINAPSPDLPVFLMAQIVFYLFLKDFKTESDHQFIVILLLFLGLIKVTMLPLGILLFFSVSKLRWKNILILSGVTFVFATLWMLKNTILTGFPLYPFHYLECDADWTIPKKLLDNINNMIQNHEFIEMKGYKDFSITDKFRHWIRFGGINGIFNKGILLVFVLALFTKKIQKSFKYKIIYGALLLFFITVFLVSPQFRFFLPAFVLLAALVVSDIVNRLKISQKTIGLLLIGASLLPIGVIFISDFEPMTDNTFNQKTENLRLSQIYLPEPNSKYSSIKFEKHEIGNLYFYSPTPNFFFYGTADGPLPTTNIKIIESNTRKLHILPQMRTGNLKDGFLSGDLENFRINKR